ncbi:MAG: signal peptide peptidase SppA [Candidatus Dormibacteraeota bacterium]|nr:signal peptide peptidase SppA [Candidatus Dormibacteraeota bacterium]
MLLFPFRYLRWLFSNVRRALGASPDYVIFILEDDLPALSDPPLPRWQRYFSKPRLSLKELGARFDLIARNPEAKGVVLHMRPVPMSMATLQDLRELVFKLRGAGKRVVAWAPFYTNGTYYLACACDEILMMPAGSVQALGFSSTGMFLADALARFGVEADFVQISPYKSAADTLTKSKMSDELREQITWLLDSMYMELVGAIVKSRRVSEATAKALIDASPYADDAAIEGRVVDLIIAEEDLAAYLSSSPQTGQPAGQETSSLQMKISTWEQARRQLRTPPPSLGRARYVAILRIEGTIVDGRSARLPWRPPVDIPILGDSRAGDLTVVQLARQVAADKRAVAAVLYVNSRGGSATASEAMRQALDQINARKPLVVVMGPVAASGGYWVATPGRWIVARAGTLTGSIGVLTGKIVTGGMWARLLVHRETISFGKHVTIGSDERTYSREERQIVKGEIDRIYELFLDVVGRARGMAREDLHPIAAGRVWTGKQAYDRKLVDELGGLDAAVRKARSLAGLEESAPAREVRVPRRIIPPLSIEGAAGYIGWLLDGVALLNRAPALALMNFLPDDL